MDDGLDCWVIDVEFDAFGEPSVECTELTIAAAKELVNTHRATDFHVVTVINGGVRVTMPSGVRDIILKASLEDDWKWVGDRG